MLMLWSGSWKFNLCLESDNCLLCFLRRSVVVERHVAGLFGKTPGSDLDARVLPQTVDQRPAARSGLHLEAAITMGSTNPTSHVCFYPREVLLVLLLPTAW